MTVDDFAQLTKAQIERLQALTSALAGAVTVDDVVDAILSYGPAVVRAQDVVVALAGGAAGPTLRARPGRVLGIVAQDGAFDDTPQPLTDALAGEKAQHFSSVDEVAAAYPMLPEADREAEPDAFLAAAIPMSAKVGDPPAAALGFVARTADGLSPDERVIAEIVVGQCAQALDRARLYDAERRSAETLQRALLPARFPETDGVDCADRYLAATELEAVGGDWYAVIRLDSGRVGLAVGDVAGHGLTAATVMGTMRNALRALATTTDSPAEVLSAFNRFVCSQLADEMATCAYIVVDARAGTLSYANAGHLPPLLVGGGPEPAYLQDVLQPPLGVTPDIRYREAVRHLDGRCHLVLYTDGLVERRWESIDLGLNRLLRATVVGQLGPNRLCDHLLATLIGDDEALEDDAALLVAAITPGLAEGVAAGGTGDSALRPSSAEARSVAQQESQTARLRAREPRVAELPPRPSATRHTWWDLARRG